MPGGDNRKGGVPCRMGHRAGRKIESEWDAVCSELLRDALAGVSFGMREPPKQAARASSPHMILLGSSPTRKSDIGTAPAA